MKDAFTVLIQNRTEFEKGNPATVFLSLPATKEELHEAMKALNITADNPQDFFLNGYSTAEGRRIEIPSDWIRDGDIDKINFLAARLEEMTPEQLERLDAVMHSGFMPESLDKLIDHTYNTDFYSYVPGILSYKELGDYFLNDSGKVQMPEEWKAGIDKESFGFNAALHEDGKLTDYGYTKLIYENGERTQEAGKRITGDTDPNLGKFLNFEEQPKDPAALHGVLLEEKYNQHRLNCGNIKEHIETLSGKGKEKKPSLRAQLAQDKKTVNAAPKKQTAKSKNKGLEV